MIHMPGCPLEEPTDSVIDHVDQWESVDCERCKQPVLQWRDSVQERQCAADPIFGYREPTCVCTMQGPPPIGCPVHGSSVNEPARHIPRQDLIIIGQVDWSVVDEAMDQIMTHRLDEAEGIASSLGFTYSISNRSAPSRTVHTFDFTGD